MKFQIITFYRFHDMSAHAASLDEIRDALRELMRGLEIRGTIILANEGYNSTVCGEREAIAEFLPRAAAILNVDGVPLEYKSSFHDASPFRRVDVKIKPEIVTFKQPVDVSLGAGTHVDAARWNEIISDPETIVIDTRNDYEFRTGTFRGAVNPRTRKFSDLPEFVEQNLDPTRHRRVAMFCTGGIRCEKFAPYLKSRGFEEVYQLEGGILKYLEQTPADESLWEGECFIFDDRRTVNEELKKGSLPDLSLESHP